MTLLLPYRRPLLAPAFCRNELWKRARAVPSLDLRFAENKSLVDATTRAQLVTFTRASSGTYVGSDGLIKTATTNLLLRSEEFDDASWAKLSSVSVSANTDVAPNGTLTADTITANKDSGIYQSITSVIGLNYANSIYVKAGTATAIMFRDDTGAGRHIVFNPSTGAITATSGSLSSYGSQAIGGGWYRYWMVYAADATTVRGLVRPDSAGSAQTFVFWGAQLEQSSTVGEYVPTTSTINSAPRFDHNPTTGESLGLLVEEQRTNSLYPSQFTSFAGSAASNVWYKTQAEIDATANAGTAPDGSSTAALLAINTNTTLRAVFNRTGVATGSTYAYSVYCKPNSTDTNVRLYIGGETTLTNHLRVDFTLSGNGTAGSASANGTAVSAANPSIQPIGNGWYRCAVYVTFTSPTGITCLIYPGSPGAQTTASQTLVWGAQLEAGAFPTSYIPTTTAAATRSADVASISGSNFSSWYNSTQGSLYAEPVFTNTVSFNTVYCLGDGTSSNRTRTMQWNDGTNRPLIIDSGGIRQVGITGTGGVGAFKFAIGLQQDNFAVSQNGATPITDTSGILSVTDRLFLGNTDGSVFFLNGTLKRFTFWPQRLGNEVLQRITQ